MPLRILPLRRARHAAEGTPSAGPPRVVVLAERTRPTNGMEKALLLLLEELRTFGDVELNTLVDERQHATESTGRDRFHNLLHGCRTLLATRNASRDATIVICGLWAAIRMLPLIPRNRRRVVIWEHSITEDRLRDNRRFRVVARTALALYRPRRCDLVVCVSGPVRDAVQRYTQIPAVVIPNIFEEDTALAPTPATQPHDSSPSVRLLSVGSLSPIKNVECAISTLTLLPPSYMLTVAGLGPSEPGLRRLAKAIGVADRVSWLGHVNNVAQIMRAADVLVHPSLSETFGYVLLEAAANQLPVVANPVAAMAELVPSLVPGRLTAAPTPEEFARAIDSIMQSPPTPREEHDALQARAARFSPAAVRSAWVKVITPAG